MPEGHLPVRSYLALSVASRSGEVLGGLFFGHSDVGVFTERHERILVAVASQAAVAIDNARLYQKAQQEIAERHEAERAATAAGDQLRAITDAVPALISYIDREGIYRLNNLAYEEWLRRPREEVTGRHMREVLGDEAWESARPYLDLAFRGVRVSYEGEMHYRDVPSRWISVTYAPQKDVDGRVQGVVALVNDIAEQKARERTLNFLVRLNDETRNLQEPKEVMAAATRLLGEHLGVSRCAYAPVEADNDHFVIEGDYNNGVPSIVGRYPLTSFGPKAYADLTAGRTYVVNDIDREAPPDMDLTAYRITKIQAVVCVSLVKGDRMVALMAVHQDTPRNWISDEIKLVEMVAERAWAHIEQVSSAKRLAERANEVEALNKRITRAMKETHHRVKNNLQVVAAMVDMQAMEHSNTRSVPLDELTRLGAHVRTLALVHDLLTKNVQEDEEDQRISSQAVLERLLPLLQQAADGRTLTSRIEEIEMTGKQCIALALVTNELVSNAVKHGRGEVDVTFARRGACAMLQVCDDGAGFPPGFDPVAAANTGLELVEGLARTDLHGQTRYENASDGGAQVTVIMPILPVTGPAKEDTTRGAEFCA
jgi:PAS domain S-box-containing protein